MAHIVYRWYAVFSAIYACANNHTTFIKNICFSSVRSWHWHIVEWTLFYSGSNQLDKKYEISFLGFHAKIYVGIIIICFWLVLLIYSMKTQIVSSVFFGNRTATTGLGCFSFMADQCCYVNSSYYHRRDHSCITPKPSQNISIPITIGVCSV